MDWHSTQPLCDMTENGVTVCDTVIHEWRETSLVCNFDVTDVILPSDAEYLMLTFHVKAFKDLGFFNTQYTWSILLMFDRH